MSYPYIHVGRAGDLSGADRILYRFFEIVPGALSWGTILGAIFLSWYHPIWMALFIITFDVYWLIKTAYLSIHLRVNWRRMQHHLEVNWEKRLENFKYDHIWQLVLLPMYKEDFEVVDSSIQKLLEGAWPKERMIITLATEERAGAHAKDVARRIQEKYQNQFKHFLVVQHPQNIPNELAGKGSNISWAAQKTRELVIDTHQIPYEHVLVSAFDIDTQIYPQYFLCLTYHFLIADEPHRSSYQPVPLYNNNIWLAPMLSRVVATSGTFWQMIQQERPERLVTFSSHSMSFKALNDVGYWQKNIVSEDSRIFWNALMHYDGNYTVTSLSYPVSLDANVGDTWWRTIKNVYKQQRRWMWGVENVPYLLFGIAKNKTIPFWRGIRLIVTQLEGYWSLPTNPLLIFLLGWLPLLLGGQEFNTTLLSYNLPIITRTLMAIAMLGLVVSAIISASLLPPRPQHLKQRNYFFMMIQWLLVPFTIVFLGAIPALDAQTRLMFGKYMGFWVTPKRRQKTIEGVRGNDSFPVEEDSERMK